MGKFKGPAGDSNLRKKCRLSMPNKLTDERESLVQTYGLLEKLSSSININLSCKPLWQ